MWEGAEPVETPFIAFPAGVYVRVADSTFSTDDDVLTTKPIQNVVVGDVVYRDGVPADEASWKWNVTSVETLADGSRKLNLSIHIDADDACAREGDGDAGCVADVYTKKVNLAYKQAIHDGAKGVEYGLTAYKEVAVILAAGPLFEAGGGALVEASTEASELLEAAAEARALEAAAEARALEAATDSERIATRTRAVLAQGGHTTEEAAALEQQAVELEQNTAKLRKGAPDLEEIAVNVEELENSTLDEVGKAKTSHTVEMAGEEGEVGTFTNQPRVEPGYKPGDPPEQLEAAINAKANPNHPSTVEGKRANRADKLEAEVANILPRENIRYFNHNAERALNDPLYAEGVNYTQIDIETDKAIIEVTRGKHTKDKIKHSIHNWHEIGDKVN